MSKHSPGPWTACHNGDCLCGLIWTGPADSPIAHALPGNEEEDVRYPQETVAANARLIAAAPELLEVLRAVVNDFDRVRATYLSGGSPELDAAKRIIRRIDGAK